MRGLGLRGSSDFHAFGDSNLDLRRSRDQLVLTSEHRAAVAAPSVASELVTTDAATTHLEVVGDVEAGSAPLTRDGPQRSLEVRVLEQGPCVWRSMGVGDWQPLTPGVGAVRR